MSEEATVWRYLLDHVWVPLCALVGIVWKYLNGNIEALAVEIRAMRDNVIGKEVFSQHIANEERVQGEIRADVAEQRDINGRIFARMDAMESKNTDRHIELLTAIHSIAERIPKK